MDTEIWLPRPVEEIFGFFSEPRNLEALTPPWLKFRIVRPGPVEMKPGALIDYRLRLHSFPIKWQSEITVWEPPLRFVDVQRRGPYRLWIHEHTFLEQAGGTLARDCVVYAPPGGGSVHRFLVAPDLKRVFSYRRRKLLELFGTPPPPAKGLS